MRRRIQHLRDYFTSTHEANRAALLLLGFGLGIIVAGFVILYLLDPREGESFSLRQLVSDLYANGGAELLSIALTVLIIERLNRRRAEQERKEELILQLGSPDNAFAVEAMRILRQKGWLGDGSLKRANLWRANLHGAILWKANLQAAHLRDANLHRASLLTANLQAADLGGANLQAADLGGANLQRTDLGEANLQEASLWKANLQEANLGRANLQGAYLFQVDLQGANLLGANLQEVTLENFFHEFSPPICDEKTILPDGTFWTPDRDWREFTHPNEWAAAQNKKALLLKLGKSHSVKLILSTLREKGWLLDGTLNHVDLKEVNFYSQDMNGANLQGANLQGANLLRANLQGANLLEANLQEANLLGANLQGANLLGANLQGVTFKYFFVAYSPPIRDQDTILPDGSHWTPGRDWREFTHPEEWAAEQAAKKRFTFSKPPGFTRGEISASGSKPNAAQKPETAEAVGDEPL